MNLSATPLHTLYLPSHASTLGSQHRAAALASVLGSRHQVVDLQPHLELIKQSVGSTTQEALGNAAGRMRMLLTYAVAQAQSPDLVVLVVGSANGDEGRLGYFSKWDASAADLNPLATLSKAWVRRLVAQLAERGDAKLAEICRALLAATPSAELWPGQTDEQELGLTYEQVERLGGKHSWGLTGMMATLPPTDHPAVHRYWQRWWANRHKADAIPAALNLTGDQPHYPH